MTAQILGTLVIIFSVTFLVEAMTEYIFGTPFDKIPKLSPYKWLLMYVSLAVGVGVSLYYNFDILYILANSLGIEFKLTFLGVVATGLVIGRGSSFLHQFVSKFFPQKNQESG